MKQKPNIKITKINLENINKHRIDMINYVINEKGIVPNLLEEFTNYYILTITTYKLLYNNETPTSKDFDIYCNGLIVNKNAYKIQINNDIIITINKNELVVDNLHEINFEIISKFILK
jgi:hypothetical protein